jgi:hypothetical protein
MPVVRAKFDGKVFVPSDPVEVAAGTEVEVLVPPRKPTAEENRLWQELVKHWEESEPPQPTLEEAMRAIRKYP